MKKEWARKLFYLLLLLFVVASVLNLLVYYHVREKPCSASPGSLYSAPQWVYKIVRNIILIKDELFFIWFILLVILVVIGFSQGTTFKKISILLSIILMIGMATTVLSALGGAGGECRDCIRVKDLRQVNLILKEYYKDNGKYPGIAGSNQWGKGLQKALWSYNFQLPHDPCYYGKTGRAGARNPKWDYEYWVSPNGQKYILKANLSSNNFVKQRHKFWLDDDLDGNILGAYCGENGPQEREYCISPNF